MSSQPTAIPTALEYARKTEQTIATNPVDYIDRIPATKFRPSQPTAEEVTRFLAYLKDTEHQLYPAFAFACMTGARQGEVLALRWTDIDPATRTVRITKSRTKERGQTIERPSRKTGNDYAVHIAESLWHILTAHKEAKDKATGNVVKLNDPGCVFTDRNGEPLPGNALTDAFRYLKPRTGLTCRVHDFRGFVTSQMLAAGSNPAEVRDIIGWRDATTLLNYYAQPTAEAGRKAIEGIAQLIAHG
ncbi:MAG: site-specific integrase [Actinomycetales bacterium]|nr:site-specific integrase [Actinomycetales bacterium]